MDTTSSILPEEVPCLAIFLGVLVRHQLVEEIDDLIACELEVLDPHVEDEVIPSDMANEPPRSQRPDHVSEDLGQEQDDAVSVRISVAVVELLEAVEVRVADGEVLARDKPSRQVALDLDGARQARRRVHGDVARGAACDEVEAQPLLRVGDDVRDHFICPGQEAVGGEIGAILRREDHDRHDRGERVALDFLAHGEHGIGVGGGVEDETSRERAVHQRVHLLGTRGCVQPMPILGTESHDQLGGLSTPRPEVDDGSLDDGPAPEAR